MPVTYHPQPERFRGSGIAYIAFNEEDGMYRGYWDLGPAGSAPLEECPRTPSAIEAVRWGRERSPVVMIRPENDQGRYYWAGVDPPTGGFAELPFLARLGRHSVTLASVNARSPGAPTLLERATKP